MTAIQTLHAWLHHKTLPNGYVLPDVIDNNISCFRILNSKKNGLSIAYPSYVKGHNRKVVSFIETMLIRNGEICHDVDLDYACPLHFYTFEDLFNEILRICN